jgi:exodeoxyribonuclease-5
VKARTWFDFGYSITVHKSQGSEWSNVILIDEYRRREERKEWLYTGITRAADKITIIR